MLLRNLGDVVSQLSFESIAGPCWWVSGGWCGLAAVRLPASAARFVGQCSAVQCSAVAVAFALAVSRGSARADDPKRTHPPCLRSRRAKWPPAAGMRDKSPSGSQVAVSGAGVTAGT